jgi:hypothetical protein
MQQFAGPQPITVQNGAVNSVTAALQAVPQSYTFRANIRGSAFTALHDGMSPGAGTTAPGDNLRIDITADSIGPSSNGLFLVLASQAFPTDTDLGDIPFANPYPPSWTPFVDYYDDVVQTLLPPGATSPLQQGLITRVVSADLPTESNPIAPLVGPAVSPLINGASLFTNQTISGSIPTTLTWQPPSVGTASGYLVNVSQISLNSGIPSLKWKWSFYTTTTSAQLPSGILSSGNSYYFMIESLYRNTDMSISPNLKTFPEGECDLGSGIISVQ